MNPTRSQLRQLDRDNGAYSEELEEVPPSMWPNGLPTSAALRLKVWRSRAFLVQIFDQGGVTRISVSRTEWDKRDKRWKEGVSWDELQSIKRQCGYGSACAVELFPPDDDVVNVANMRHLFIIPAPRFMWRR